MEINGFRLQFVVSIHHVGSPRTGVMAVTSFGRIQYRTRGTDYGVAKDFVETSWDAFSFSHDKEVENRTQDLCDWLDQSLATALRELSIRVLGRANRPVSDDGI